MQKKEFDLGVAVPLVLYELTMNKRAYCNDFPDFSQFYELTEPEQIAIRWGGATLALWAGMLLDQPPRLNTPDTALEGVPHLLSALKKISDKTGVDLEDLKVRTAEQTLKKQAYFLKRHSVLAKDS